MGLKKLLLKPLSGYPGGYKQMRRGFQGFNSTPPFKVPEDPTDRRSRIPPAGYREYWYPALPAKDVKKDAPSLLRMLGTDVIFFKDKQGDVQALLDWCPHRAVYLSMGRCYFEGFVTCPYHGATFDGDGNCVAFLTEGPESKMVGAPGMKARKFPTVTLKGMVFVWMGDGEPVSPEEDIPPEMFEDNNICRPSFCMFDCNWVLVLENTMDAHNAFMVHRNALRILGSRVGGRPRTPLGYRVNLVNNKNVHYRPGSGKSSTEKFYYDEDGKIPYQMYYPGVDGVWPLHKWRLAWTWFFDWKAKRRGQDPSMRRASPADTPDVNEWNGTRLPGMSRTGGNNRYFRSTRWPVPVEENLTRMVYINVERYEKPPGLFRKLKRESHGPTATGSLTSTSGTRTTTPRSTPNTRCPSTCPPPTRWLWLCAASSWNMPATCNGGGRGRRNCRRSWKRPKPRGWSGKATCVLPKPAPSSMPTGWRKSC